MLIVNVTVLPVSGERIDNGFIRFGEGKLLEVGPMSALKARDGEVYDGQGCLAMPGLVDAHSHLGLYGDGLGFEGEDGNEATDPVTPHLRAIDGVNPLDRGFAEALDYGVTTVVCSPGSANAICGQICALKTGGSRVDDMALSPALAMKMALGENPKETYARRSQTPTTRMATAALIRETLARARRYQEELSRAKEDAEEYDPPEYDAKCEALLPVLEGRMPVHFHAHRADDLFTALRLAKEFALRAVLVHGTEGHLVAKQLAGERAPVICGPLLGSRSKPELVAATRRLPALLAEAGVQTAICTDHPELPQDCLMLSAALAHRAGLPYDDALRAVTLTPAQICGLEHRIGSLEAGKDADILLFDRDPLGGLEKPAAVWLQGVRVR